MHLFNEEGTRNGRASSANALVGKRKHLTPVRVQPPVLTQKRPLRGFWKIIPCIGSSDESKNKVWEDYRVTPTPPRGGPGVQTDDSNGSEGVEYL